VIHAVAASVALLAFQKDCSSSSRLTDALWNQLLVGVVVGALAIWAAVETSRRSVTAQG
jgi:SPW repeat